MAFNKKVSSQAKKQENTIHKKKKLINWNWPRDGTDNRISRQRTSNMTLPKEYKIFQ